MEKSTPSPAYPGARRYSGTGALSSGISDTAHDSGLELIDRAPETRMMRCIEQHDTEFREKLDVLAKFTNILAKDHAKAISRLKKVCMNYVATCHNDSQARPASQAPEPTIERSSWVAPRPAEENVASSAVNSTSGQTVLSPTLRDVARSVLEIPSQTELQPGLDDLLPNADHGEVDQPSRVQQPTREQRKISSVDGTDDTTDSSDSTDDGDHDQDIYHEESPGPDETPRTTTAKAQSTVTPQRAEAPNRPEPSSRPSKSSQPARDSSRRWTQDEENFMIDVVHDLMQEDFGPVKTAMWKRASATLRTRGYDRTYEQMMAKWSCDTRRKCEERGLDWAATVMAKLPHMARKRRSSLGDARQGGLSSTIDGQPRAKRVKSQSQRRASGRFSSSAQSDAADSPSTTQKPKKGSRKSIASHPALSPSRGFTTKFDSLPPASETNMRLRFIWERASSDIVQVDWSPDAKYFVAASNSILDASDNFRENQPVNLIHGSLATKTLRELPEHRIAGDVSAGQPKYLYQTVSAVRYAPTGDRVLSAGFDNKVRLWDVEDEASIYCKTEVQFAQRVEVMDVAGEQTTLFATGTAGGLKSIRIFFADSNPGARLQEIKLLQDTGKRSVPFSPTCLKFGRSRSYDRLLAGFGSGSDTEFGDGCTAMWKFREAACDQLYFLKGETFVFDCAWSPAGDLFAIGSLSDAETRADATEHSVVKLYSPNQPDSIARYSCRAKDINDVTIDYGLVTASCTDGCTYVWDQRQPQKPLHTLAHGRPVVRLARGADREMEDVGVRYIEWSRTPGQLYTGSSDGFLKYWDTGRSPTDVLVEDLVDAGREILCGRLSPDHSSLLLGDEEGRLLLFSTSKGPFPEEEFRFRVGEQWAHEN
ncbi:hypothetical protein AYL99_08467 [Fonsecaea erecta]|uniref:Uncharacterized protein n=1 Tax=Fonsecaea erecta TaxID=1367422 RepID=A0A178ZD77_9EURO|nr:hypothetical protein AYL99_08467 [Fonsecaea erecta]OAP57729.1 hypothetical protein AYL99_08467 [Fonsecaea erecta]